MDRPIRMTPLKAQYLERLLDGPKPRAGKHGNTGFNCMRAGWLEWDFRADGEPVSADEYWRRVRANEPRDESAYAERITEAGRRALAEYRGGE